VVETVATLLSQYPPAPGTGVSPTLPAILPVIPPVDVHDTICPVESIPIAPTVPTPPLKSENKEIHLAHSTYVMKTNFSLLSDFSRYWLATQIQKVFQCPFRSVRHQIIVTDRFQSHFQSKLVGTRTHQEYVRGVFHHFSGQRYWMRNVLHAGDASCERRKN